MNEKSYLMCERSWVYDTLIAIAGFWGAFTYLLCGNVFCNAQTGNIVLMGMALGSGEYRHALYYLFPLSAYLLGSFISELVPNPVKHRLPIRWDTLLILLEMIVIIILGFLPDGTPVQVFQVSINFIASMQYNTFRQSEGVPMATTFATNHVRQIGIGLAREIRHLHSPDKSHRMRLRRHFTMLAFFFLGTVTGTISSHLLDTRAIWLTLIPFLFILSAFLYDDLRAGRKNLEKKPAGH